MGLLSALNSAVSGLNVNQQNLTVLSQNITNANTPGYTREVANQAASFIAGQSQGVTIASITRTVNDYLNAQVRSQTAANSTASTLTSYYSQIQNLLGQPGAGNSIDQGIANFFVAVQAMANSPSSGAATSVVNTATSISQQISNLASALQGLRLQSDNDITSTVNTVNADLLNLYKNNIAIEQANATHQNTNGLMDQRDSLITDLSQYLDIRPVVQSDGTMVINTNTGITLLTTTTYAQLSHASAPTMQTFIDNGNLDSLNVSLLDASGNTLGQPIALATGGKSSSITTSMQNGKIVGLMQMRDSIIPNVLSQLDQLASSMRDNFNAITNAGTSFPPPNSYTGTTLISGGALSAYSGNLRIGVLSSSGSPVASPYADESNGLQPMTLDLSKLNSGSGSGISSVDNLINAINQYFGTPQNKLEIGNINNAQLAVDTSSVPNSSNTLNFDFNLNNISGSNAPFYVGGYTILDDTNTVIASSGAGTVTTTQPALNISTYQFNGTDTVTLTTSTANNLANGDIIYLNPPSGTVNGISGATLGGYFVVSNVSGNTFQITATGASAATTGSAAAGVTALTKYDTVNSGGMERTNGSGTITADLSGNITSSYYTVQANIATVDSSGNLVTSTVTYKVPKGSNTANNLIGVQTATGGGTIVAPTTTQPMLTATLVDANGNPLAKTNGAYGNQQGYLKITAANGNAVAIDEMDSKQLGLSGIAGGTTATNQGFSQYFGLNNFFNPSTSTTDTLSNSAINLSVASRLVNNPGLLSTGKLSLGNQPSSGLTPNFTYILSSGDNSISQRLAGLGTNLTSFGAIGGLSASSTTFSQYAAQIIAATSTNSANATTSQKNSQALLDGFTKSAQTVSGVNLDQELANTVIYQNAYSASARIISIVSTMFDALINSVR